MSKIPVLGDVDKLSDLITDFRYFRNRMIHGHGSVTPHPDGFFFIAIRGFSWRENKFVLYGKPTQRVLDAVKPYLVAGHLSSLEIIPWPHVDKALVVGRDKSMIGSPWIAFIPLSEVPSAEFLNSLPLETHHA